MSDTHDPTGPDIRNLRSLSQMLPNFVQARAAGKLRGLGKNPNTPANCCRICGHLWGAGRPDEPFRHLTCEPCQKRMDTGEVAIVCGSRLAWVKSVHLQDEHGKGQMFNVTPETFDQIEKQFKAKIHDTAEQRPGTN